MRKTEAKKNQSYCWLFKPRIIIWSFWRRRKWSGIQVNDPHPEEERQFSDLVTFTHDSDFIEEVSVSLDNSDHASDFSAESDSYGDKSEDEDNFWEDVDILDDPFTEESNLERQQREMGKKLANWAATGNIPRTQVNELLKLLRSNAGLMYLPLTLKNSFKNS